MTLNKCVFYVGGVALLSSGLTFASITVNEIQSSVYARSTPTTGSDVLDEPADLVVNSPASGLYEHNAYAPYLNEVFPGVEDKLDPLAEVDVVISDTSVQLRTDIDFNSANAFGSTSDSGAETQITFTLTEGAEIEVVLLFSELYWSTTSLDLVGNSGLIFTGDSIAGGSMEVISSGSFSQTFNLDAGQYTLNLDQSSSPQAGTDNPSFSNVMISEVVSVPEPSSSIMVLLGLGGCCFHRSRKA
ncbi:PEP-CTERM sorting domain-containing protein [Rubritalea sp.]|uniref:PEP-CTERM sorting domain-containing protein n=1 Tax=Rubritalea sp. TaxID=2109375 RepID=UPI003EF69DC8